MTFEFVNEALNNLKNLSSKDKKYKPITDRLTNILQDLSKEFLSFKQSHEKVTSDTIKSHGQVRQNHQDKIQILKTEFVTFENKVRDAIKKVNTERDQNITSIKNQFSLEIERLNQEINELELDLANLNKTALNTKSKDLAYIEKVIADIKKQSAKSMHQIKQNAQNDLAKIEQQYQKDVEEIEQNVLAFEQNVKLQKERINQSKQVYREQSDSKYLSVKNDYHQASTVFNKKVDQLKKKKDDAIHKLKKAYQESSFPITQELAVIEAEYQEIKAKHEQTYQEKIESHKQEIVVIIEKYNEKKEQIIKETSESISLFNSKLSAFREALLKDRQEQQKEYNDARNAASSEEERKNIYRDFRRKVAAQDNELNKQVLRTRKDTLSKTKEQYERLNQAEIEFLEMRSKWRVEGKILLINEKLESYYNEQNYEYKLKEVDAKLKKLKHILDYELELLEIKHLELIAPLDKDLAVANSVSERDINLLSNDTNYHLTHFQHQDDLIDHKLTLYKLENQEKLEKLKVKLEHDKNVLMMTEQLSLEKETVIQEQRLKNQALKQDLVLTTFEMTNLSNELDYLLDKIDLTTQINYKIKEQQFENNFYHDEASILQKKLETDIEFEKTKIYYQDQLSLIDTEVDILKQELDVIHSRIHFLFNQVYVIYNVHHHFMIELINLYQLPAHPEDVKQYISLYLDVFRELSTIQTSAIDDFLVDMQQYHETRINDLTNHHYQSNLKVLTTTLQDNLKALETEENTYHLEIKKIDNQILVLSSNIDRIQSKINQVEIKQAETQDKKEIKQLQSNIDDLQKQINSIESEMQKLDKEIQKFNKPIDKIRVQKENLQAKFEKDKETLATQQQSDAKVYFQQLSFYKNLMRKMTGLFVTYESKVQPLTEKLNQPVYITDDMMKDYEKNFKKLESFFERQSHEFYQALLKGSIDLFAKLNKDQINLKSSFLKDQKEDYDAYEKFTSSIKPHLDALKEKLGTDLVNLENEKQISITTQSNQVKKEKSASIEEHKALIKAYETQIMTTEQKITTELLLIDSNLKSVLTQLGNEYQKNLLKVTETYLKNTSKANDQIELKIKNLKQLEETTQLKNNLLNTKFQQTELKLGEQLKEKLANYQEQTTKKSQLQQKRISTIDFELKAAFEKMELSISNYQKKSALNATKLQNEEKRVLERDLKDANQSYLFKQKSLKL